MLKVKLIISISIFSILLGITSVIKTKTRIIEKNIYKIDRKIAAIEKVLFDEYKNRVFRPSKEELKKNNRSRSAKLRFAIRSSNKFNYPENLIKKFRMYLDLEAINV